MANELLDLSAIDVREELEAFEWRSARWQPEKLICASPFREDRRPSFYVYLEDTATAKAGNWGDSGTGERGGIVALLARLRETSEEETIEYLQEKYGIADGDTYSENFKIKPIRLRARATPRLDMSVLERYKDKPTYVIERGVHERTARLMDVGQSGNTVAFPWKDAKGRLRAVKYRSISNKTFWYEKGGEDVRNLLYGIDVVHRFKKRQVAIVEGEIDALYLMTAGIAAVAIGSATMMNERKAEMIASSPAEEVVIMPDNDDAGYAMRNKAIELLRGYAHIDVKIVDYPQEYGDPNDIKDTELLRKYVENSEYVRRIYKIL